MRFLPQRHGGKMFAGGIGPEQSADLETASGQTRVVRRKGLHRAWPLVLLDTFVRIDPRDHRFRLRTKAWRLDAKMGKPGIDSQSSFATDFSPTSHGFDVVTPQVKNHYRPCSRPIERVVEVLARIPTGFHLSAQGCAERTTLGHPFQGNSQSHRGCITVNSRMDTTLSGLIPYLNRGPNVAPKHPGATLG